MNIVQTLRRINMTGWNDLLDTQRAQVLLVKKLYAKHGLEINGGSACPEQYDVFKDGKQVAYYRLRHGMFTVDYPDCGEETIYEAFPNGDGIFNSDERLVYLSKAMRKVLLKISHVPS